MLVLALTWRVVLLHGRSQHVPLLGLLYLHLYGEDIAQVLIGRGIRLLVLEVEPGLPFGHLEVVFLTPHTRPRHRLEQQRPGLGGGSLVAARAGP